MKSSKSALKSFPRVFWVANIMEFFERGAYYGMNSVLAVYLAGKIETGALGFSKSSVGLLQSVVYALTYIIPIFGGALAERFGYRKALIFAFSLLSFGYFATGHMTTYGLVFASLIIMAVGSGSFKPIISGTIARSTDEKNSGLGFGIYYMMINLGALISPILVAYLRGFKWSYVFMASSLWCALMLLVSFFLYKDPPKPESTVNIGKVISGAILVLKDFRFILMILIYSGFWILYFQMFNTALWYMQSYVDMTPVNNFMTSIAALFGSSAKIKFDVAYVTSLNAGTIVVLQMFISRIVKNIKALPVMIAGICIGTTGFILLSISSYAWFFIVGIMVFSIGEMTCHPKYYSYVGLIAPKDKVAVYMGYAFFYGIIGSLIGNNLGANLYVYFVDKLNQPRLLWMFFSLLGIATIIGLFFFNKFLAPKTQAEKQANE
ncbi:MAG: MFS transporter [Candidatus Aminicenantia bacterium]